MYGKRIMTLKTIVACFTAPESTPAVAAVALRLAERHKAHLIALHVIPRYPIYNVAGIEFPDEIIRREEQAFQDRASEVEKLFAKAATSSSAATEWRCEQSPQVDLATGLLRHIPSADLIVMSQLLGTGADLEMAAEVVIGAGRPVLIMPGVGEYQEIGRRVVIAWNGKREATRAAFDALPLLEKADSVHILTINPDGGRGGDGLSPGSDLALALSRHGIKAVTATSHPADISDGDDLLSRIADESCDLLVMGCYGHSRLREFIFGGVTRHILKHMTVPVLMSH
jgi:nucleotide-binding universal stress UspA family protein